MKTCTKCRTAKQPSEFHVGKVRCKTCVRAYYAAYISERMEANRSRVKAWRAANRSRAESNVKAWRRANPHRVSAMLKAWRLKNPERYGELHRRSEHRRRVRKASNAPCETFTERDIYERDGWTCGLCGLAVNPNVRVPDPLAPTLDHVVPVCRGGGHTRSNVQLAHYRCNLLKGSKP